MLYELYKGSHYCVSNCVWHLCDYLLCVCNSEIHKTVQTLEKQSKLPCGTETKVEALILCSQSS